MNLLPLAYTPFVDGLPVWNYWMWLILPMIVGVSIVYKCVKCAKMSEVPKQAAIIAVMITLGLLAAAIALAAVTWILEA
jgi:NAD/NADP transhydrogenase beta subunit